MGLTGTFKQGEQTYPTAYAHVCYVRIHWGDAYLYVNFFSDKDSRDNYEQPIHQYEYRCPTADLCNGNILSLAYAVVKQQKDFVGWTDVMEGPSTSGTINEVPPTPTVQ